MLQVGAGADVHVQAVDDELVTGGQCEAVVKLFVPDAVLGLLAAGVGFLAVAVAEAGVDAEGDAGARGRGRPGSLHALAVLGDHVGGAAVDGNLELDDEVERFAVEDVGGVADFGRVVEARLEAGGDGALDFAGAHRVDQGATAAHQVEDSEIGARLLGEAHHVERGELGDALGDDRGVVDVERRAEALGEVDDALAGDGVDGRGAGLFRGGHAKCFQSLQAGQ